MLAPRGPTRPTGPGPLRGPGITPPPIGAPLGPPAGPAPAMPSALDPGGLMRGMTPAVPRETPIGGRGGGAPAARDAATASSVGMWTASLPELPIGATAWGAIFITSSAIGPTTLG